jgi:RNA polymerase sigma factor (TIGR02999 family)
MRDGNSLAENGSCLWAHSHMSDATILLGAIQQGDPRAAERLLVLVYAELRKLAASKMAREREGQTLQPTALVHEAWLRLVSEGARRFENRAHFFASAAEAMRRILVDRARRRLAVRHGGGLQKVEFDDELIESGQPDDQLLAVHEALDKLSSKHPLQAELVKLRYFTGLTIEEAAELLNISVSTAGNYWLFARTWLLREIERK